MEKASIQLGSEILCADSYMGMKSVFRNRNEIIVKVDMQRNPETERSKSIQISNPIKQKPNYSTQMGSQYFSLLNLHKHLSICKPSNSHWAEVDCSIRDRVSGLGGEELQIVPRTSEDVGAE